MSEFAPKVRQKWVKPFIYVSSVLLIGVVVVETLHWWRHVDEPNASVEVDFTLLSTSVNGTVKNVYVHRGERVLKGALLASMDTTVASLDVDTLDADIAREQAKRDQIVAELALYQREVKDKIATATAAISLQRREHATWRSRLLIANSNVVRYKKLASQSAISRRQLDDATDRLLSVTAKLRSLETAIKTSQNRLLELTSSLQKKTVYQSRIEAIDRAIDKISVQLRQSKQRLIEMDIRSPISGIVDEVYVSEGVYVEDADKAFLLHDPDALWLEAEIDESNIGLINSGQSVRIEFDAYPYEYYQGEVRSVGDATLGSMINGGKENADPRVAQRIRVLIDLPKIEKAVWPGMRASVNITVR